MNRIRLFYFFIFLLLPALSGTAQTGTLDYYLKQAFGNSPQLNDFRNQAQSSGFDSAKIRAGRKPQVNMLGQILVAPSGNGYGYDNAVTNSGNYELVVGVSQNLFTKNILAPQYESLSLQRQAAGNSGITAEHEQRRTITSQYIQAYADILQMEHAVTILRLLQEESSFLRILTEKGVYKPFDFTSFQVALQSQEIALKQQEFQYRTDLYALNLLCGINDTAAPRLAPPSISGTLQVGLASSRFLTAYRIDSLQISNRKLITGANYKAKLSWFADGGILGSQPAELYHNVGTSFGLNFSLPIYDGRQKQLEYKKIGIAENTRSSYESFFKKQYQQEILSVTAELSENDILISQTKKQLSLSEEQIQLGKNQLNIGALPVSDFILAIRTYNEIKNNLNQLQVKQLQLMNELNYWNW
jgi:outer membrane protein TolC